MTKTQLQSWPMKLWRRIFVPGQADVNPQPSPPPPAATPASHAIKAAMLSGLSHHQSGRFDEAKRCYLQALAEDPRQTDALNLLGVIAYQTDDLHTAVELISKAIALSPSFASYHSNLGNALQALGRFDACIDAYQAAIRLQPEFAEAHYNLGIALHVVNRFDAAIAAFEAALRLKPDYTDAQSRLHFTMYRRAEKQGAYEAAFAHLCEGNRLRRPGIPYEEAPAIRLMERMESVFSPALLRRAAPPGGPPDVPIFILGMPRSGSTLVEQILASHRGVTGGGELRYLGAAVNGLDRLAGSDLPYPENSVRRSNADFAAAGAAYRTRLQALSPGAGRITDKTPANFHHVGLIKLALPRAKIIHTRRDPVDTCFSCFAQTFTAGQPFTNDLDELGRYYQAYARLMAHWRAVLPPGAMLEVDYETLVADFEPQVRRILDYCELDWDPACLSFYEHERTVLTASAQQVRQKLYSHAAGRTQVYGGLLDGLRAILNAPFST